MRRVLMFLLAWAALAAPVVRGVRIDRPKGSDAGRLLVMVGDRELAAAGEALRAWPAMNGTAVLYTRRGSYPDQQQLRLFDAPATVSRTLASVPGTILDVMQDMQPPNRWIFVLSIRDEGTGVPSLAVVGAEGGILYREILAVPGTLSGGQLSVLRYTREEIARVRGDLAKAQSASTDRISLATILARSTAGEK